MARVTTTTGGAYVLTMTPAQYAVLKAAFEIGRDDEELSAAGAAEADAIAEAFAEDAYDGPPDGDGPSDRAAAHEPPAQETEVARLNPEEIWVRGPREAAG